MTINLYVTAPLFLVMSMRTALYKSSQLLLLLVLLYCRTVFLYCRTVLLYCRTVLLYCRTVLHYCRKVLLYRMTVLLYCRTVLLYEEPRMTYSMTFDPSALTPCINSKFHRCHQNIKFPKILTFARKLAHSIFGNFIFWWQRWNLEFIYSWVHWGQRSLNTSSLSLHTVVEYP